MNLQNSKVAKTFDVGLYRLIAYVVILIFGLGVSWAVLNGTVKNNTVHRADNNVHLSTDNIISNVTMDNQVRINVDDIDELETTVNIHDDIIHKLVTSDAVQAKQFESIDEKLQRIIDSNGN